MTGKITFYCGENPEPWGPGSLDRGIGGSEEAAIHMAQQFAAVGWETEVYGVPPESETGRHRGVVWRHWRTFDPSSRGDVFIAWRDPTYVRLGQGWGQIHHWLHNRQDHPYDPVIAQAVDRVIVVSQSHGEDPGFRELPPGKLFVTTNGIDEAYLREPGHNQPDRAIYASCPARGLYDVLAMWPRIRRVCPAAKLDVYNGFTPVYEAMAEYYPGLLEIKKGVLEALDQDGVTFHGRVGQHELAEGFAQAGVWLLPTETPETSCITAMKALAMGALPITTGAGAIAETLGGRDLGPAFPDQPITQSRLRRWRFRRSVVRAMRRGGDASHQKRRLEWAAWARETYAWSAVAWQWRRQFAQIAAKKGAPATPQPAAPTVAGPR